MQGSAIKIDQASFQCGIGIRQWYQEEAHPEGFGEGLDMGAGDSKPVFSHFRRSLNPFGTDHRKTLDVNGFCPPEIKEAVLFVEFQEKVVKSHFPLPFARCS